MLRADNHQATTTYVLFLSLGATDAAEQTGTRVTEAAAF